MTDAVRFTLNGSAALAKSRPSARLSQVLRHEFGQTGTKIGCDAGDCGACSVLIDGAVACACMVPLAQVSNTRVVTIEGLARQTGCGQALQQAFLSRGAAQCGICTPGMLVAAAALLERNHQPSQLQIEDALSGVLCRCTGYRKIIAAVADAAMGVTPSHIVPVPGAAVGARLERLDGHPKVDGHEAFGADLIPADALFVRAIRSPFHHAAFRFGDTGKFLKKHPGLVRVLTAGDVPGRNIFGVIAAFADQPVFAERETRFKGEAIAAIVGERAAIDQLDLSAFQIGRAHV